MDATSQDVRADPPPKSERLLTIGQLVALLRADFADLSITKVRYLEDRGLLSPARTSGRYRKYGAADVRRLRTILTLQRDEFLPLEVIRQRIDKGMSSALGQTYAAPALSARSTAALMHEQPSYTWEEACEAAGVDDEFLRMLVDYRIVDRPAPSGPVLSESDIEAARICHMLARFGVEPRNLRLLSSSVEREAALLGQVATPALRSTHADKREYGETMLEDLGALFSRLAHLLLYRELRKLL